mmetsp:Transcript_11030/g.15004  ORF Transcript_11030/g.15004 Transcript_11030/m.15004 type:complete len:165 (+) Transcript_11030:1-495(+)
MTSKNKDDGQLGPRSNTLANAKYLEPVVNTSKYNASKIVDPKASNGIHPKLHGHSSNYSDVPHENMKNSNKSHVSEQAVPLDPLEALCDGLSSLADPEYAKSLKKAQRKSLDGDEVKSSLMSKEHVTPSKEAKLAARVHRASIAHDDLGTVNTLINAGGFDFEN